MVPKYIGRYEIISELGRGGMATVYLARDPNFDRNVAVKVLPREYLHDSQFRARFEREAQTIAQLEHPAIVPVYDYGETDPDPASGSGGGGQPYIVMRLMPGGSLADHLRSGPLPVAEAARLITRLARALDKAHDKGIVHRDLKPANILFDEDGHPYISDFGIAKILQSSGTVSGLVLGTPAYMSPEQARGERDIDGRSDLYTLGAILFETLTGKLPYESDTPMGQAVKHITEPVPRILTANPNLPPACESVIERAMAKDRADRYATARDMAAALDAIVKGHAPTEQITGELPLRATLAAGATQPGATSSESRQATPPPRRPPAMAWGLLIGAGLSLTLIVGVLTAGGLAVMVAFRPTSTLVATATLTVTATATPTASPTVTPSPTPSPTVTLAPTSAESATPAPSLTVFRRTITSINASKIVALKTLAGHTRAVTSVAFSPDGQLIASGSYDKTARVWYIGDGSPVRAVERHQYTVFSVAYSPDGATFLVGGNDGFVSLWDSQTGAFQNEWRLPSALSLAFSPDHSLLAVGTGNGTVRIYRWLDQQLIRVLEGHTTYAWGVVWSPDGQLLASASDDGTVRVWNVDDGTEVLNLAHPEGVLSVTFSPSGDSVITGCRDADIRVWRTDDGELLRTLETHTSWIGSLAFSEDGSILASGSYDGTVGLWRWVDGSLIRQLTHGAGVLAIAFSPDGTLLASGAQDNMVLIWGVGE